MVFFSVLTGLSVGHYKLTVGSLTSEEFRVTDDANLLSRTTLVQYRFKDNRQREDVVSVIDHMVYFFDFRVPVGFKDNGWQFGVSNEQFTTQREDIVELFAHDYARSDSEAPQIQTLVDGLDSFVFTQMLRKAQVIDPKIEAQNQAVIRRIDDAEAEKIYRSTTDNINRLID